MAKQSKELLRQARALARIKEELGFRSQRQFARAIGVDNSQVSRWMSFRSPKSMGDENRLKLAWVIGQHGRSPEELDDLIQKAGWEFRENEVAAVQGRATRYRHHTWESTRRYRQHKLESKDL